MRWRPDARCVLFCSSAVLAVSGLGAYGLGAAATWAGFDQGHGVTIEVGGGTTLLIGALLCFLARLLAGYSEERGLLIRTLADVAPKQPQGQRAVTGPFPRAL